MSHEEDNSYEFVAHYLVQIIIGVHAKDQSLETQRKLGTLVKDTMVKAYAEGMKDANRLNELTDTRQDKIWQ